MQRVRTCLSMTMVAIIISGGGGIIHPYITEYSKQEPCQSVLYRAYIGESW